MDRKIQRSSDLISAWLALPCTTSVVVIITFVSRASVKEYDLHNITSPLSHNNPRRWVRQKENVGPKVFRGASWLRGDLKPNVSAPRLIHHIVSDAYTCVWPQSWGVLPACTSTNPTCLSLGARFTSWSFTMKLLTAAVGEDWDGNTSPALPPFSKLPSSVEKSMLSSKGKHCRNLLLKVKAYSHIIPFLSNTADFEDTTTSVLFWKQFHFTYDYILII